MQARLLVLISATFLGVAATQAQSASACADLAHVQLDGVEITKTAFVPAGAMVPVMYAGTIGPLPEHCRVDGVIDRRKGVDGVEYGIGFGLALPSKDLWNGDFMMQGGGGAMGSWRTRWASPMLVTNRRS